MRIGLTNIFSFRPHVEHLYYLSVLLEGAGHDVFFLTCDAAVTNCYPRALKNTPKVKECCKCMLGGVRSYPVKHITSITSAHNKKSLSEIVLNEITLSSSCPLHRTESDLEWNDTNVLETRKSLYQPVSDVYYSARSWIEENRLDAVICFNGRMDLTRAVTYACEQAGIPFITHERTWFGDGLTLIPNANCLSIKALGKMALDFDNLALTYTQAKFAASLISLRFLQKNSLEWRLYNKDAMPAKWPSNSKGQKILVLPSSKNEFAGHSEWKTGWLDNTSALDDFFVAFSVQPEDVVVRFHPNWAETIGSVSGERPLCHYTQWAKSRSVNFISSEDKANTYDLIQQADIVVMNGGSSAVEAGACGKQVICLGPSPYEQCGFVRSFLDKNDLYRAGALENIDPDVIIRKTLRYVYLRAKRFPQYVDFVRAKKTTEYEYFDGADPDRLINMLVTGEILPDDAIYAATQSEENAVVDVLKERNWQKLVSYECNKPDLFSLPIQRRWGFRWLDTMRDLMPRGDR